MALPPPTLGRVYCGHDTARPFAGRRGTTEFDRLLMHTGWDQADSDLDERPDNLQVQLDREGT